MPHRPRVLDKISLFFQRLIWADLRQDRFGLSKRNLILVFGACQSVMSAFDSNRRSLVRYTYPNLAVLIRSNQSVTDGYAAQCFHPSLAIKNFRSISIGAWCRCSFGSECCFAGIIVPVAAVEQSASRRHSAARSAASGFGECCRHAA